MDFSLKKYLFFLLFLSLNIVFSQFKDEFINGVLLDSKTNEPVVFATIRVEDKALGVISNQDGGFRVPTTFQLEGTILEISSMGYETKRIPFSVLTTGGINTILMTAAVFELNETTVTAKAKRLTARKIIKYALERIPDNYPQDPFSIIGYYRDYQLKQREYVNLNEAIVQVYDVGFQSDDYQQISYGLFSYTKNKKFEIDSFAAKPYDYISQDKFIPDAALISDYGGNELVILHIHDAIRNHNVPAYSFVGKMTEDFIGQHRFSKVETTAYNGEEVYKIGIRKSPFPFQVRGFIYIDKNDYAIRRLDYAVYKKHVGTEGNFSEKIRDRKVLLYEISVEYADIEQKMYLNYISFHNKFVIRRPAKFKIEKLILDKVNGLLEVQLNKPAKNYDELKLKDIELRFKGQQIQFRRIVSAAGKSLTLKLSDGASQVALRNQLFSNTEKGVREKPFLQISTLIDEENNLLDERKLERLDQFREFFTQQVANEGIAFKDSLMLKTRPLYDTRQPMYPKKKRFDFWMNTPLKNVDQ
ncbi:hypothetical protein MTsPCn5_27440 [Croceitalea sp. MTPC5]|uniref:carboxypeptidase-like regulatory domain-containing protein n=1 Tax=Croceitalea sp. MTPC5 TaxID=3056565 RepID=UPI002B3B47CD|nr:hypothetical protein MTsPCn5_27440 [Croceitalea sp. MTPC5]